MASKKTMLQFYAVIFIAATVSSFTIINAEESSRSDERTDKDVSALGDSSIQEDSKEKRSQEEIMFGNQQNKPNGLVDDLMGMTDNSEEDENSSSNVPDKKSSIDIQDEVQTKEGKDEKRNSVQDEDPNDMMMGTGADNWYSTIPVSPNAMQYLANTPTLKSLPSEDFANSLYDQEDLYRRKRQLLEHPLPLHKRSLRSSIGQMIQKRGIRMPRRSMRLKRQVDMEDLLNLFGNDRYYEDEQQVTPHSFSGRAQTVAKRHVPGRFSSYPETSAPEFRYPYVFQHRGDGILSEGNDMEENNEAMEPENLDDIDNLMLLHPNNRYSDLGLSPYGSQEDEKEAMQKWLSRHTVPSVFRVSRRSAPFFYPIDYRYIPGYKKRSRFGNGNLRNSHFSGEEEPEADFGKWGHVVQMPEAYASPEDVARLYGLANLMAEAEGDSERKMRRST